jgi:hypothetical protein
MPLGLGEPNAYIALPVTPRILFIASREPNFAAKVAQNNHETVVRHINNSTVKQAREYVWGSSASQLAFVQRNIATLPDRELITDEQRQIAIATAKGESAAVLRQQMLGTQGSDKELPSNGNLVTKS